MTDFCSSLPPNCIVRPARKTDRWVLQQLVLNLIWSEALGFDARIVAYRLVKISLLSAVVGIDAWLLRKVQSPALQSVVLATMLYAALWAIALILVLLLYVVLIPTEPLFNWSMYWVVEHNQRPVACAAMSHFSDFYVLYHVVVDQKWRRRSLASCLIRQIVKDLKQPVYLVCKPKLAGFYANLGFVSVSWKYLSKPLQIHFKDFEIDRKISRTRWEIMAFSQADALTHPAQ
ncbi:acetyltransferase, N-acetylglutamate synthase [Leptolyngbyaceae cyanobacterium JSC-12]|nr:acetyltransferase, N-acetylglutamate synthase [Leptolyngbyaceae cyanobacterium JSC-12]